MSMQRRSGPAAALPGEKLVFAVATPPDDRAVTWSGGGDPATGSGRRFATRLASGGTYTVTARCGDAQVDFPVTVCPVDMWLQDAEAFYGPAVDLTRVSVKSSRAVAGPAWTCNDVIRFRRPRGAKDLPSQSTLIHELAHVWQHQRGGMQLLRGLVEQTARRLGRDPYDYGGPERLRTARHILEFSNEGQAEIVMEFWRSQHRYRKDHRGRPFSSGYVDDLRRLVEGAGIGTSATTASGIMATPLPGLMAMPPPGIGAAIDRAVARLVNAITDLVG